MLNKVVLPLCVFFFLLISIFIAQNKSYNKIINKYLNMDICLCREISPEGSTYFEIL